MLSLISKVSGLGNSGEALETRGILGGLSDMRSESEGEITRGRRQDVRGKRGDTHAMYVKVLFYYQGSGRSRSGLVFLPGTWASGPLLNNTCNANDSKDT